MAEKELTQALYQRFLKFKPGKGDLRRIAIIESAIDCLSTIGVEAATLEAIGKKQKMSKAHVAYYYDDRRKIVEAAIKFVVSTVQSFTVRYVQEAKTEEERLEAFINGTFDWVATFPKHTSLILLLYYYASFDPFYRKLHTEIRDLGAERLAAVIAPHLSKSGQKALPQVAKLVQSLLTGNIVDHVTTSSDSSLEQARKKTIKEVVHLIKSF